MAHLGVLCPEISGHLHPMMSLCRALQSRGHRITFYQRPVSVDRVRKAGFACQSYAEKLFPPERTRQDLSKLAGLSGRAALGHTARIFATQAAALTAEVPALLDADGIDALVVDQTLGSGPTVAELTGRPFVTVCNAMTLDREPNIPPFCLDWPYRDNRLGRVRNAVGYHLIRTVARPYFQAINKVRLRHRMTPITDFASLAGKARVIVCQQPREFDFPRRNLSPNFHYVGPMVDADVRAPAPFPWDRLGARPLIYASMGTLQNGVLKTFATIARACHGLGVQLVLSLGGGSDPSAMPTLPGDPIVVGFAPQLDLIRRSTLVITHAGLNTTLECLSAGVPMVAIPITNDQPGVAARIGYTGVGEFIALSRLSTDVLRAKVKQVLREDRYRNAAVTMSRAIAGYGGAEQGARVIESALDGAR